MCDQATQVRKSQDQRFGANLPKNQFKLLQVMEIVDSGMAAR